MMNTNTHDMQSARVFGPVYIGWAFGVDGESCAIDVKWQRQLIAQLVLDAQRPELDFNVRTEQTPLQCIAGRLTFDATTGVLVLDELTYPNGEVHDVVLGEARPSPPPLPPPPPPPPVDDENSEVEQAVVSEASDLFPYIHLQAWPPITAQALADGFILYEATCATDDPRLYCRLAAIDRTQPDARSQMIDQALRFVQGEAPYEGQFAVRPAAIGPEFAALAEFTLAAQNMERPTVPALVDLIAALWGAPWPEISSELDSPAFASLLDRAWQNVFALNCVLGYDRGSLAGMIRAIVSATLLRRLAESAQTPDTETEWTTVRLRAGLRATIILPGPVFPLPSLPAPDKHVTEAIVILPYAIGNLHLVKRRLLGYALGEVSHVESVMADEKKVRALRESIEDESQHASHATERTARDDERSGNSGSLDAQVRDTLKEQFQIEYSKSYGPPTESQQTGSYTLKPPGDTPTRDRDTGQSQLARRITQRAAQQVSSRLSEQRLYHRRHARESDVTQCFDRRGRSENQRGIYRWLDARYRCWVVRVGRRLMLEYFVPHPAARLANAQRELTGIDLTEPQSPAQLGVRQFDDISLDPASGCYYATLAATFGAEATPPPAEHAYASAVFETGAPLHSQLLALPPGYVAATATVALTSTTAGSSARGRIGAVAFTVTGDGDGGKQTVTLDGQADALPISIAVVTSTGTEASGEASDVTATYGLNIEIDLQRGASLLAEWKSRLYNRLVEGYQRQLTRYFDVAGVVPTHRVDPLARQRTIRGELKRAGMRGFLQVAAQRTGELAREGRFAPALRLWLDQALEWSELTYTLIDDPASESSAGDDGEPFTAFLQATHARVLLPVSAEHERSLLYFLASGMVWTADDTLAPTFDTPIEDDGVNPPTSARYVDLMDDLKTSVTFVEPVRAEDSWALTLSTAMTVLQDGDRLPEFPEPA